MDIKQELITTGQFYLPGQAVPKLYGRLEITKEDIFLELLGSLDARDSHQLLSHGKTDSSYEIVHGDTIDGYVALYDAYHSGERWGNINFLSKREQFGMALVGDEYFGKKEPKFDIIHLHFIRTKDFVAKSNLTLKQEVTKNNLNRVVIEADMDKSPMYTFTSNGYKFSFEAKYSYSMGDNDPFIRTFPLHERVVLSISKQKGKISIEEIKELTNSLRNFFAFALRDSIYPVELLAFNKRSKEDRDALSSRYSRTQIYIRDRNYKTISESRRFGNLFTMNDISKNTGRYLSSWFKSEVKYKTLHNNFFGYVYKRDQYYESLILALTIGIENYIEKTLKKDALKLKLRGLKRKISNTEQLLSQTTENEVVTYLQYKLLEYQKDVSLKQKLLILQDSFPNTLTDLINEKDINIITELRNRIAHGGVGEDLIRESFDNDILGKLKKIIEYCLLRSMGFSKDTAGSYVKRPRLGR